MINFNHKEKDSQEEELMNRKCKAMLYFLLCLKSFF